MTQPINHSPMFRFATLDDVTAIIELVHTAYRGEISRTGWTSEADFLDGTRTDTEEVSEIINTPNNCIVLCENNNQLRASLHLQKQADAAYLGMFAVLPALQGRGIGKAMLEHAEQHARNTWQCIRMQMTVITLREELITWYQRHGYQRTGRFKPFPYGIARYGAPKRDDLILEILEKHM